MNTRLTLDLGDSRLMALLKMTAAQTNRTLREIVVEALTSYLSGRRENRAVLKLAEKTFAEWDNPKDSDYDKL